MIAYYNEFDPYAAQWLRNLIAAGHIAPGIVDERSIEDVTPQDLEGFTQCHFFAGVGVWSLALRRAGWPDDRPVWTGSCPCQPFSSAGAGAGFDDPRHLWPRFGWLIKQRRPPVVIGEQVASKAVDPWIDLVQADLEAVDYAFGAAAFPSAGVGAPHIRDRAFWVGHTDEPGPQEHTGYGGAAGWQGSDRSIAEAGIPVGLEDCEFCGHEFDVDLLGRYGCPNCEGDGLADAIDLGRDKGGFGQPQEERDGSARDGGATTREPTAGPTNGFWSSADWLFCRDGKWRPVEPGTFPLVDGAAGRVGRSGADWHTPAGMQAQGHRAGRIKGYGNAINAEAATQFIGAYMDTLRGNGDVPNV